MNGKRKGRKREREEDKERQECPDDVDDVRNFHPASAGL